MNSNILLHIGKIVYAIPLRFRRRIFRTLGYLVGLVPFREQRICREQLRAFVPAECRPNPAQIIAHLAESYAVAGNVEDILSDCILPSTEEVKTLLEGKTAVIGLSAHIGFWELIPFYFSQLGLNVLTIGREARNPLVRPLLEWLRSQVKVRCSIRGNVSGTKTIVRHLQKKGTIGLLIDQDTRVESTAGRFLGKFVRVPTSLIEFGLTHKADFFAVFALKEGSKVRITLRKISGQSIDEIITAYHYHLEQAIMQHPEQWAWVHKRWRSNESGASLSGKEYENYLRSLPSCTSFAAAPRPLYCPDQLPEAAIE